MSRRVYEYNQEKNFGCHAPKKNYNRINWNCWLESVMEKMSLVKDTGITIKSPAVNTLKYCISRELITHKVYFIQLLIWWNNF